MSAKQGKMRLDQLLVTKELVESRHRAQAMIMAGLVLIEGKPMTKAGAMVSMDAPLEIKQSLPFVSRGGQKLEKALDSFNVDVTGKTCIDVGASTGGFTDCLLQHGATKVFALDVGHGQLDVKLRNDPRVINIESTNIRYFEKVGLPETPDLAVIDVSFISLDKVLPAVYKLVKIKGEIIALIKPQFEAGPKRAKGGVVRDSAVHVEIINRIKIFSQIQAMEVLGVIESPLLGPAGNKEFFIYLIKS